MKKSKADVESLKEVIIETAIQVFSELGYSATNIKDIAERAGITRTPVYYHFENKYVLYEQAVDFYLTRKEASFQEILGADQEFFQKIKEDLLFCTRQGVSEEIFFAELHNNLILSAVFQRRKLSFDRVYEMKMQSVRAAMEKGELRADTDPAELLNHLYALHFGLLGMAQCKIHSFPMKTVETLTDCMVEEIRANFGG